ncbi:MAG: hypothetical protein R2854_24785 [Caldilineaceae bacterium]
MTPIAASSGGDSVRLLDQRRLPHETVYLDFTDRVHRRRHPQHGHPRRATAISTAAACSSR